MLPACEAHVWSVDLRLSEQGVRRMESLLDDPERSRARRYRFSRDRRRFVVTHGVLRMLLGSYLRRPPARIRLRSEPRGKPLLEEAAPLHFNLSRSGDLALLAFSRDGPLGVDVEWVRAMPQMQALARRHFTLAERRALDRVEPAAGSTLFFRIWTGKEAVIKALGVGLALPLDSFDVPLDGAGGLVLLAHGGRDVRWHLAPLVPGPGVVGALATERQPGGIQTWRWCDGAV